MKTRIPLRRLALTLWLTVLTSQAVLAAPAWQSQAFQLPAESESLLVADTNGDQLRDLITVVDNRLRVYFQDQTGFDFDSGYAEIEFAGNSIGWDISSAYSEDGSASIIALVDGREVRVWEIQAQSVLPPRTVQSGLSGFLNRGLNRLHFSRDINGDQFDDLVIPGAGQLHILINRGDNSFQPPLSIRSEMRLRSALNNNRLNRSAGQAIRIPRLELRDMNNDGSADLVSRTDEYLSVFLARPGDSSYFPGTPSYSLDIAAIEERLGEFDIDNLDFSNLTGVLALTHEELLDDVNGDGIADLLLREGGKVSLFAGNPTGMDLEQPSQVLRSGGNVLSTFLYDENEDGRKDLWLWRVEPISVGDVFVWLALSGSIAIEAFVYPNEGERFARRPARRLTVNLRFPSVMRLANAYSELNGAADAVHSGDVPPNRPASLDSDADRNDLLVLVSNRLNVFMDSVAPQSEDDDSFLGPLGYNRDRDDYEIDIRRIIENVDIRSNPNLTAVADRSPDFSIDLDDSLATGDVIPASLNADDIDDVFVFTEFDGSHIQGILLLSR